MVTLEVPVVQQAQLRARAVKVTLDFLVHVTFPLHLGPLSSGMIGQTGEEEDPAAITM